MSNYLKDGFKPTVSKYVLSIDPVPEDEKQHWLACYGVDDVLLNLVCHHTEKNSVTGGYSTYVSRRRATPENVALLRVDGTKLAKYWKVALEDRTL